VLTVEEGLADSHKNFGWETFTDAVIAQINDQKSNVVFILWGAKAAAKASIVDNSKHLILKAVHPSPLAAHRGFFGCRHFSKTNAFLRMTQQQEIQW
jgi:uracil-DNA glycosylase